MNNFKTESLIANFQSFVGPLTDMELSSLCNYMTQDFNDAPPDELAKRFIEDFLGHDQWVSYIQDYRRDLSGRSSMFRPIGLLEDVANLKRFLMAESSFRYHKYLMKSTAVKTKAKNKWESLKVELSKAIDESYFDGSFDKIEGFSNISDVLLKFKLVKYPDE